jgi:hypothetical protein
MTSDQESATGDATQIPIVAGPSGVSVDDADGYGLPSPELSPSSSPEPPEPASTPDSRTGLPKRIVLRKNWSNPVKESQARSVPSSGEPSPSMEYDGGDEDESIEPAVAREMASVPDQPKQKRAKNPAGGDAEALEPTPPKTPQRSVGTVNRQSRSRNVSGMSSASVARHEIFEEINPMSLMGRLSQSSEPALPQRMPAQTRHASFHSLPSLEPELEVAKVSGELSDSAVPRTPPNKRISRKKLLTKPFNPTTFSLPRPPQRAPLANRPSATATRAKGKQPGAPSRPQRGVALLPSADRDVSINPHGTEESHDPSFPQHPYLRKFTNNKAAQRVSISSPTSVSVMSATDSVSQQEHPSSSSDFEAPQKNPLPAGPIFKDNEQRKGTIPPVNTPAVRDARRPEVDHDKVRTRERSRSDPPDLRDSGGNELPSGQLFDHSQTRKMDEAVPDPTKGASMGSKVVQDADEGSSTVGESAGTGPSGRRIVEVRSSRPSSSVGVLEDESAVKDTQESR